MCLLHLDYGQTYNTMLGHGIPWYKTIALPGPASSVDNIWLRKILSDRVRQDFFMCYK